MKRNDELRIVLSHELAHWGFPPAAKKRLGDACRGLGEQKRPEKKRSRRAWAVSVSAVAAAFALLLGVNAAFPAFAEELPLIGGIFAQFNGKSGKDVPANVNQTVIDRSVKVEASSQAGPAAAAVSKPESSCPVSISLSEASCDGLVLDLALTLTCTDRELNETPNVYFYEDTVTPNGSHPFVFTANGIEMEPAADYVPFFSRSKEDPSRYTCVYSWYVPESLRDAEILEIGCSIPSLRAEVSRAENKLLQTGWESSFRIDVNSAFQIYTPQAELCGGVYLNKVTLGVSVLDYQVVMPADMDPRSVAVPLDGQGEPLPSSDRSSQITDNGDGTVTCDIHMSFGEADLSSLTFRVVQWPFAGDEPEELGSCTLELEQ